MRPAASWNSLCVFFVTLIASLHSFSSCPMHHRQSLLRFKTMISSYYAADSSSFTGLTSWNSSSIDCCTWERVSCSQLSTLKPVEELHLSSVIIRDRTYISSEVLLPLFHIKSLLLLDVSLNFLQGRIPLGPPNLLYVNLSFNYFSDMLPLSFGTSIQMILLNNNDFSGKLFMNFSSMPNLRILDLHDNKLTGEIPYSLGSLASLCILNLKNNRIHGPILDSLANLTSLRIIDLSNNKINGIIPPYFVKIIGLISNVFENPIFNEGDVILNWKGFLQAIEIYISVTYPTLDLSNNELTGEIPKYIGELQDLKALNLSYNKINGTIPTSIGQLKGLESLDLSHNKLSGEIPTSFGKLNELGKLDLSNNILTGKIPEEGQMLAMADPSIYANNNGLCGIQINVQCAFGSTSPKVLPRHVDDEEGKGGYNLYGKRCVWAMYLDLLGQFG